MSFSVMSYILIYPIAIKQFLQLFLDLTVNGFLINMEMHKSPLKTYFEDLHLVLKTSMILSKFSLPSYITFIALHTKQQTSPL